MDMGQERAVPECIVLPVRPGVRPSGKPPVRIFLGTEPAQFRPERVFAWSVEKVRDPGRVYEIHLMKDLAGYRKRFWTTSFTNYRFAVPHYAGRRGRALYNDEDQIYLADPGALFDLDMAGHGYLTISDRDTAVMLIDCERMADVWTLADAQRRRKHWLLDRGLRSGLCGPLPPEWHARDDEEFDPARTRLLHYTTLHTQPWRPFPERFVYREHPQGELWFGLEREARRAGFELFTRERPSARWSSQAPRAGDDSSGETGADALLRDLVARSKAASLLLPTPAAGGGEPLDPARWGAERARRVALTALGADGPAGERADGVACLGGLEALPTDDLPWVVEELFRRARRFVFAALRSAHAPPRRPFHPPSGTVFTPDWWVEQFETAAARHPGIHWQVALARRSRLEPRRLEIRQGGAFPGDALPRVWVLLDSKPGHSTQSIGLAEELGWPYERVDLEPTWIAHLPNAWIGASRLGMRPAAARRLQPPWPDLVIASGRRAAPVARWIRRRSLGRTRIVQLGRMGVTPPDAFDLTVVPGYARLLPHPRRLQTLAPLTRVRPAALEQAARRWRARFECLPRPRVALLVGGHSAHYRLTPDLARVLAADVTALARAAGGCVLATTSRRTRPAAAQALEEALADAAHVFRWSPERTPEENPYAGYLALADVFVVTGESASMLAEACATGRPVFVYPLPRGVPGWRGLLPRLLDACVERVLDRADARPLSRRGITRPQRGLELLLSRMLMRGWVRPSCDFDLLHRGLEAAGLARRFDGTTHDFRPGTPGDLPLVAGRVRALLGVGAE
jgi:mitochondrial fission protein ELM1